MGQIENELENQIKSNRSLIYIMSHEEQRVDEAIQQIVCNRGKPWQLVFWDIASGAKTNSSIIKPNDNMDQITILDWFNDLIIEKDDFCVLVLHDFYKFLSPNSQPGQAECITIRSLRNLVEKCNTERKCVILTGATYFIPTEFDKLICLIDWPLPDKDIIKDKLTNMLLQIKRKHDLNKQFTTDYTQSEIEEIILSFMGLTLREIELILTYFILTENYFDPQKIASKKKDIIKKSGILEWIELDHSLTEVGGLPNLKTWLKKRKTAFSESAKEYGLPEPKGLLIIGCQGAGKSWSAKAISSYWKLPLLKLDIGRIFSSLVGSSEENLRSMIKTAESIAPCIIFADEIDKAFSSQNSGSDGGTSSRVFGTFLTWMSEKTAPVFVVATANDISNLPPELIRKGRFDDIFFVDLPDKEERKEIWAIHLKQRNLHDLDINQLIEKSENFTGAEIEAAIISAMYEGFSDNQRAIKTVDIITELQESIPISITMKEKIESLRQWSSKRARNASKSKYPIEIKVNSEEQL